MARWTDKELGAIKPRRYVSTIAKQTGRSEAAVRRKAKELGVPLRDKKRPAPKATKPKTPSRPLISAKGCASPELIEGFFAKHLHLVDGSAEFYGQPFLLEEWQRERILEPIFGTLTPAGDRQYREAVIGLPRNGAKSTTAAGLALSLMVLEPVANAEYVVVARNQKQARIVFEKAKAMVLADPLLSAMCDVRTSVIIVKETGQKFYTVPWDAGSVQGIHARVVIIDEYHVHRNASVRYAMLSGMVGQPNALLITISTAGAKREGPLWDLLKAAQDDPRAYICWIGAADDDDFEDPATWKKANPQSWVTLEDIEAMFHAMPIWEFVRYHLNCWPQVDGLTQAVSVDVVDRNFRIPNIDPGLPVVLGLDAAPARDRCALMVVQKDAQGHHHWQPFVWQPGRQMEFGDFEQIEQQVRDLAQMGLYITRIVSDPAFVWLALNRLKAEGFPVEVMKQDNAHMCAVAANLHKLLTGDLLHFDDELVRGDLLNVSVEQRPPYGWRMGKLDPEGHIDCAIAGGMASFILESDPDLLYSGPPVIVG